MDVNKLSPEPWEPDFENGEIEGVLRMVHHGNVNTIARNRGEQFCHADLEFIALARKAFGVMQRRGWGVKRSLSGRWHVEGDFSTAMPPVGGVVCYDPFTALIEADRWYAANCET